MPSELRIQTEERLGTSARLLEVVEKGLSILRDLVFAVIVMWT